MEPEKVTLEDSNTREAGDSFADRILDDLLPEELDWRNLVRSYPVPVLSVAALGGFFLARKRGMALLGALSGFVADEVSEQIAGFRGDG